MFARERCTREIARVIDKHPDARDAIMFAFALGEECAREDIMHRACLEFSEARAARERLTGLPRCEPPRT